MGIRENPDGILKTSVSWDEFESHLRYFLGTDARLGANRSVVDIGVGNGFISCCGLISCDWVGTAEGETLPSVVVLKIPSILPLRRLNDSLPQEQKMFDFDEKKWEVMEGHLGEIHNTEVATYEFFDDFEGLSIPKMYYAKRIGAEEKESPSGQICLEYVNNSRIMNFYERHTVEQVRQIARALGSIQSFSLKKEVKARELNKDFFKRIPDTWTLDVYRSMFKRILAVDNSDKTMELMEKIDVLVPTYYSSKLASTIHHQIGFRPVLVNGDLHTGNVLIDKKSENLAAIVDWQCSHLGVGVEDLHRITISALTTNERRAHMPKLLEEMYNSLVENLDGVDPPYTLDTLRILADLIYPQCALFFVSAFIPMITKLAKDTTISDTERARRIEVELDKVIGALEDVVILDNTNKIHLNSFKLAN